MSLTVIESIRTLSTRAGILARGSCVLVAVSGGQDSCALLHALAQLRDELGIELCAAHLNHGFRGEAAEADATFVQDLAGSLGVRCVVERQDVPAMARRLKLSNQEAARRARHGFLERVADEVGASEIAFGHTRDDRVETILMNILRGTGVNGLAGLTPRRGRRVRPLLETSREETARYCRSAGIDFRMDSSNDSPAYTRNRVRDELLPLLEGSYNPTIRDALLRLGDLAEQDTLVLDELAADAFERATLNRTEYSVVLSCERLRESPRAIQRRLVRCAIAKVRGHLVDVEQAAVERVLDAAGRANGPRFQFTLPNGDISIEVTDGSLRIEQILPVIGVRRIESCLPVPGRITVPEFCAHFEARVATAPVANRGNAVGGRCTWIRKESLEGPVVVRNRRPGDRLRPAGLGGTKKVQDLLVDSKVPRAERDLLPMVCDGQGVLWIPGVAVDERCLRASAGESVVVVEMIPAPIS